MEGTIVAKEAAFSSPVPPALELVSGRHHDPEPLAHGMRAVQGLLGGSASVLFTILPQEGLAYQAASGTGSALVAQSLGKMADDLEEGVQGPCVLASRGLVRGELDGLSLVETPLPEMLLLAERVHRRLAFGLAVTPCREVLSGAQVRFAHSIFRDLGRLLRDHESGPAVRTGRATRWEHAQFEGLVGASRPMRRLFRVIEKLASSDVNVLILGESGTGKELVARAIHDSGLFAGRKFVAQNCAALPEALLESELFGHCKGAFTGAHFEKRGLFEEANGGTFFLDEIADMPIALQIKLLRVLQEGEIRRLGETRSRNVSVRIVAATNKKLSEEVSRGNFRQDLFYRLNVVKLDLSPLRRRREDIPLLARYFCDKVCSRQDSPAPEFSDEVLQRFVEHDWPGNVRELENEIERLVALHGDCGTVRPYMLSEKLRYGSSIELSLDRLQEIRNLNKAIEYLERTLVTRSLERNSWNKSRSASELGISRQGLIKKIKRLELLRPGPPRSSPEVPDPSEQAIVPEPVEKGPPALPLRE